MKLKSTDIIPSGDSSFFRTIKELHSLWTDVKPFVNDFMSARKAEQARTISSGMNPSSAPESTLHNKIAERKLIKPAPVDLPPPAPVIITDNKGLEQLKIYSLQFLDIIIQSGRGEMPIFQFLKENPITLSELRSIIDKWEV